MEKAYGDDAAREQKLAAYDWAFERRRAEFLAEADEREAEYNNRLYREHPEEFGRM